jgi:hypothetical protein
MNEVFIPDVDVWEDYVDGSGRVQVAYAGMPMQMATAIELGLVGLPVASSVNPVRPAERLRMLRKIRNSLALLALLGCLSTPSVTSLDTLYSAAILWQIKHSISRTY